MIPTPARRPSLPRRVVVALCVTAAVMAVAVGVLVWGWQSSSDREVETDGPLVVHFMDGQYSTFAPDQGPDEWWGSYASGFICLSEKSSDVRITDVELITREGPPPVDSEVRVRTVTSAHVGGDTGVDDFVMSSYGRANEPVLPYAPEPVYEIGQFSEPDGIEVTRTCDELEGPDGMTVPMQEMVISLLSAEGGAVVDSVEVNYEVGDQKYRLVREFRMLQCGPTVQGEVRSRFDDTEATCVR